MKQEQIKNFFIEYFKFLLSIVNFILIIACDPYENYFIFCGTFFLFVLSAAIESLEMLLEGLEKKIRLRLGSVLSLLLYTVPYASY